jgi:hypothetical protein
MTRRLGFWIALVVATTCSAQQQHSEQNTRSNTNRRGSLKLTLTTRAERQGYRMSDSVPLEVQLTNPGPSTLYLFDDVCWNPGNFLTIDVFTPEGKEVSGKLDYLRDCLPPPPRRNDTSRFFKLEPESFYGIIEKFTVSELVPGPGEYDIVIHYEAALSVDWIAKYGGKKIAELPIWTRDCPILASNRLRITVKP